MKHVQDEKEENITVCKVCGLGEGTMTTDCPGEQSWSKADEIYNGRLDYREGEGWVNKLSPSMKTALKMSIFNFMDNKGTSKESEIIIRYGIDKKEYNEIKKECIEYRLS